MKMKILTAAPFVLALAFLATTPAEAQTCSGYPHASNWISCNLACEQIAEVCCPGECRDTVATWDPYGSGFCSCETYCGWEAPSCGSGGGGGGGGGTSGDECDDDSDCVDTRGPGWYCVVPEASYSWCELEYFPH